MRCSGLYPLLLLVRFQTSVGVVAQWHGKLSNMPMASCARWVQPAESAKNPTVSPKTRLRGFGIWGLLAERLCAWTKT